MFRAPADARDRRGHIGVRQIELGLAYAGVALLDRGFGELPCRCRVFVLLATYGAIGHQRLEPRFLTPPLLDLRGGLRELRPCLRERNFVRRAIDFEQRRAFFHRVSLAVELFLQDAGNARAHLDLLGAFDLTDDVEPDRNALGLDLGDVHRHRGRRGGRCARRGIVLAACGDERDGEERQHAMRSGHRRRAMALRRHDVPAWRHEWRVPRKTGARPTRPARDYYTIASRSPPRYGSPAPAKR